MDEKSAEIDALNRHMSVLQLQNSELGTELEKFVEADNQVRQNLDRKTQVNYIRGRVDEAIQKSMREVEARRSPERQRH